jgi:hypothetical protein
LPSWLRFAVRLGIGGIRPMGLVGRHVKGVPAGRKARLPISPVVVAAAYLALLIHANAVSAAAFINIVTPAITLSPTPTDYANDYAEATGAGGMSVKVKTNSPNGLVLMVRSSGTPQIASDDLLVRTLTPPGTGGSSLVTYTPLGTINLNLWSTGVAQGPFIIVQMDVRIRNLFGYGDAGGAGGSTSYTNTLTFTVMEP